jgi:hypothetical protein
LSGWRNDVNGLKTTLRTITTTLLLLPALAVAGTVFTWVDEDGTTHFSETPPADATVETRSIEIDTPPSPVADDRFSVINQAQRMQEMRLENERARTERLQAEAEADRARAEAQATRQPRDDSGYRGSGYYPLYYYPQLPGHRPGYRPGRPGHLPSKPGQQPSRPTVGIPSRR